MSDRFWVGGSGNWNDTAHWSATSGGAGGASVPGTSDNALFDANSFTAGSRTVTFNVSPTVITMDFSAVNVNAIVSGSNSPTLTGNLILKSGMTWSIGGASITFSTTGTTCNLTTAGVQIQAANIIITGSGTFNFQDAITLDNGSGSGRVNVTGTGTVNTNGNTITALQFQATAASTLNLGASNITLSSNINAWSVVSTTTVNAGTSTITVTANNGEFVGASKTYYNVTLTGTPITVTGCNTYNKLTLTAGKTANFPNSCIQTIGTLQAIGTSVSNITIRTTGGGVGSVATFTVTTDNVDYVDVKDNTATNPMYNPNGTDSGNNTNWFFTERPEAQAAFLLNFI